MPQPYKLQTDDDQNLVLMYLDCIQVGDRWGTDVTVAVLRQPISLTSAERLNILISQLWERLCTDSDYGRGEEILHSERGCDNL